MSKYLNDKAIENAAEGFWARHKWCVIGGSALFITGLILGFML